MDFSVLMSVYKNDNAYFLRRAIESVTLEQTLKPSQLVLVKDGPLTEDLDNVIESFTDKLKSINVDYTVIAKPENKGLAAALNTGLNSCGFDVVARMDSDDVALPNRFEKQIEYLSSHPEISILGGIIEEFESDENIPIQTRVVPEEHKDILEMLKTRNPVNHMTVVYKKQDILALGGYCENFGKLEDYKLWVDASTDGLLFHNLPDVCVKARVGYGFIERRSNRREIQDWDMLQKYLRKAKLIGGFKAFKNKIYIRIFIYMPAWLKKFAYKKMLRKRKSK